MTVGATLVASLLATLARPATWPLALATFLIRGGLLAVLAPIVVLPTAVEVGNVFAPALTTLLLRGVTPSIIPLLVVVVVGFLVWLVGGGLIAAAAEVEAVRRVGAGEDDALVPDPRSPGIVPAADAMHRVLLVRLLAYLPLLLVGLPWALFRYVVLGYQEFTGPSDVAVPIAVRIVLGAPDAVLLLLVTWLLGETVGALASRRVIPAGAGVGRALAWAMGRFARRPLRSTALTVVPLVPLVVLLVIVGLAGSATWDALRGTLSFGGDRIMALVLLVVLVALFSGGLVLIGVASAWRAAVWTVEVAGTFGPTVYDPEGQWNGVSDSGTLADLRPRGADPDTR